MRSIVNVLRYWEFLNSDILKGKCQQKYEFVPLETHQALVNLGMRMGTPDVGREKPHLEMTQPNIMGISEDEGTPMQVQTEQCLNETLRFYDKIEV